MKNIYHEGKLINKAGVDRVVLSHVELKKINWPVFKKAILFMMLFGLLIELIM